MALKTCMNILCGTTSSAEWKTGWRLRSGDLAILCDKCGYAFEQCVYCEEFHADDSGWRECVACGKRLHCGCSASWSLIELLDGGGVKCISCARNSSSNDGKCNGSVPCTLTDNHDGIKQLENYRGTNESSQLFISHTNAAFGLLKHEELLLPLGEVGSTHAQSSMGLFQRARLDISTINMQPKDNYETLAHPNLNITLGVSTGHLNSISGVIDNEREQRKMSNTFHQGIATQQILPRPDKLALSPASDTNVSVIPQIRVARPPVEGRGRHHLLPRYWPRITEQELQQISGDSNCTIVPLFEKVLSASDAGRIGRLVLPKACAEAYFPPISQPEGLPIKIKDVKGKEWVFQFRFWPNNNSRMYVLEGVTPCIQSMQLQAGDTVTFSRMDPEGKLVMGFRKASNSIAVQSTKGSTNPHISAFSRQADSNGGNISWHNNEKYGGQTEEGMSPTSMLMPERKKSRNIGSKTKRLLIDSHDVLALRLTWEELQDMLRPPQCAKPSIVVVNDFEFEEYEEPPVFGKRSIFTVRSFGEIEQWVQCDSCSKWRKLPSDILLPPKWTCAENAWDQSRCFCSAPDELGPRGIDIFPQLSKDFKKRRMVMSNRSTSEQESPGLDALANAAGLGDTTGEPGCSSVAATTKHPRHRPGCTCIVCIQPPSGKGKHKSTCTCTVCLTVKRRFKTLMMRKKKRQSEQEAHIALINHQKSHRAEDSMAQLNSTAQFDPVQDRVREDEKDEVDNTSSRLDRQHESGEDIAAALAGFAQTNDERGQNQVGLLTESGGKGLDLNIHPEREEDRRMGPVQGSMMNVLQRASFPFEAYMKHNVSLPSLLSGHHGSPALHQGQVRGPNEDHRVSVAQVSFEQVNPIDESCALDNKQNNDPL